MEANELRIGNLVFVNWEDAGQKTHECHGVYQLPEHKEPVMATLKKGYSVPLSLVEPIPLTEEWLLKFGFKKSNGNVFFKDNTTSIELLKVLFDKYHFYAENRGVVLRQINDVHDLQNLYFALTGEELTIKELSK